MKTLALTSANLYSWHILVGKTTGFGTLEGAVLERDHLSVSLMHLTKQPPQQIAVSGESVLFLTIREPLSDQWHIPSHEE